MPLSSEDIAHRLDAAPGWKVEGNALVRQYVFASFPDAIAFLTRLAFDAEASDHHPDLTISYKRVTVRWSTHDEGGVTDKDFAGVSSRMPSRGCWIDRGSAPESSAVRLKTSYSAREVASLTGLSARQLQSWDVGRVFLSAIAPRRTSAGGFTERRYSPVDVLELIALADLRRRGFTPAVLRQMMDALRDYFRRRLSETLDDAGELRLLTDGRGLFLRTRQGHIFDLLADPMQPLLTGDGLPLKPVAGRPRAPKRKPSPLARPS